MVGLGVFAEVGGFGWCFWLKTDKNGSLDQNIHSSKALQAIFDSWWTNFYIMLHLGVIGGSERSRMVQKTANNRLKTVIIAKIAVYSFWAQNIHSVSLF